MIPMFLENRVKAIDWALYKGHITPDKGLVGWLREAKARVCDGKDDDNSCAKCEDTRLVELFIFRFR